MSRYSETCELCSNAALADALLKAEACRFKGNPNPYAALETHLSPTSLPSVHSTSFMGATFDGDACCRGDSVTSTVLALCHSIKSLSYVVHIIEKGQISPSELANVTSRCMGGKECIVLSVSRQYADERVTCSMCSSSSAEETWVEEASAMKILLSLGSLSRGMVWYWSADLLEYSYLLNADKDSMWTLSFRPNELDSSTGKARVMVPSGRESAMRVLPFFYCEPGLSTVAIMGTGGVNSPYGGDLAVDIAALSRVAIDRAYCSTTSTGRCFCCEYLNNLHSTFHVASEGQRDATCKLRLSKQFWQTTKGS